MKQIALFPILVLLVISIGNAQQDRAAERPALNRPRRWWIQRRTTSSRSRPWNDLAWMVGQWVDRGEDVTITTNCSWTKNRKYLTRSFRIAIDDEVTLEGTQVVGWDPIERRIRSWTFDSEGGFGEGRWIRDGSRWLVKTSFVLATGDRASALNVFTYVDPDTFRWQSIDREIGGELQPNISEVTVVRQKAEENVSQASAEGGVEMKKDVLILTASILTLALVSSDLFAQRGGVVVEEERAAGPALGQPLALDEPAVGAESSFRGRSVLRSVDLLRRAAPQPVSVRRRVPARARSAPVSSECRHSPRCWHGQRPAAGQRPSSGQLGDFLNLPKAGSGTRPGTGKPPVASQLPNVDRGKIQNSIGAGAGQRPAMPDWFKPGSSPPTASQLPARPGAGEGPGRPPAAGKPPVATPPIAGKPPVATPPIAGKPGTRPPGGQTACRQTADYGQAWCSTDGPAAWNRQAACRQTADRRQAPGNASSWRPPPDASSRGSSTRRSASATVVPRASEPPRLSAGHWWRWATAGAVTGWVVHRWANPIYYSYGSGGTVYYENNVVYVNGEQYGSAEEYYNEASRTCRVGARDDR